MEDNGIQVEGLVRQFKKGPRAVDGIDLVVEPGEIYGFLGPNGAGKSTTVHMLTTLPLDFLRLDAELVQHTSTDKALNHTLLALVRKAHQLGAAVIAPGIESLERAHVLLRLGIDYGVGDGLGRSLATPDFDFNRPIW